MKQHPKKISRNFLLSTALLAFSCAVSAAPQDAEKHQIFAVENALAGAGYRISSADGVIDDSTRQALRSFQEQQSGLRPSGEINDDTLVALGVKRESKSYDRQKAEKAAAAVKPSYDPTQEAAPAGKAGNGEDAPEEESGWLFSW
ncbi:MAG: hypothetical protein CL583_05035 [Alteromonadaceae bacterium]|nr:hypothetical protein [Alteromonadaceae bacterium]|tara:strand:- start:1313 stop:1747 length:435 start_codon:yes stop_codon:yes gene_type:complete